MNLPLTFTASAIPGAGRGKEMGIPTINVDLSAVPLELGDGIYACTVKLSDSETLYGGAMHYGPRPVFDNTRACEVHIIDTELHTAPTEATITVLEYLREIKDFPDTEALVKQIETDIQNCRNILKNV